jgi:hypothetical protein
MEHKTPTSFAKVMVGDDGALDAQVEAAMKNWHRNFDEAPFNENRTVIKLNALLIVFLFQHLFCTHTIHVFHFLDWYYTSHAGRISPFIEC